jgi:hypothetical protein
MLLLTTAVGVRLALIMYASLISFLACAELQNCLWMLARRCCGREAILMDVRRAADDMAQDFRDGSEYVRRRKALTSRSGDFHMAATFRWTRGVGARPGMWSKELSRGSQTRYSPA